MRHAARIRMMIMYALRAVLTQCLARDCVERCVGFARVGHRPLRQSTGCVEGAIRGRRGARHGCIMAYVGVCGFRRRLRSASACGFVQHSRRRAALLRCGAVRVHAPRLRVSHGPRGPAALLPRSGPRSARPVVRSCPRPKSARRDVQGVPCAVPGGVVRFRVAQHRGPVRLRPDDRDAHAASPEFTL